MLALAGFLLTIGILVVIHEYGHYLFARLFKVKVISFSIGFGPKLLKWQGRHNQWCISAIPLGGYVQMLDERESPVPDQLKAYAFNNKPAYQKLLIAFGGPLFNILFAFLAYYGLALYGVNTLKAGIASINPTPLVQNLNKIPARSTILAINGQKVDTWNAAEKIFSQTIPAQESLSLSLASGSKIQNINFDLHKFIANSQAPSLASLGLYPLNYLSTLSYVEPQSAAARYGLKQGDTILAINQQPLKSWFMLATIIQNAPNQKLNFTIRREQKTLNLSLLTDSTSDENGQIIGKIGIMPTLDSQALLENSFIKYYGPLTSITYAAGACLNIVQSNLVMLRLLLGGQVSLANVGGPLTIAKASQTALRQGVKSFVDFLALISLSLAVMNLLPIPVLDGGHILLYAIEWLYGKPLSLTSQQILFKAGLVIVLAITSLALYNDFLKLFNQ